MTVIEVKKQYIKYPVKLIRGSLDLITMPLAKGNQIEMFCSTIQGERKLLPDYGLPDIVFRSNLDIDEIKTLIKVNLTRYFPDTEFQLSGQENSLYSREIDIRYRDNESEGIITITV